MKRFLNIRLFCRDLCLNPILIQNLYLIRISFHRFFNYTAIGLVIDSCFNPAVKKRLGFLDNCPALDQFDLSANFRFNIFNHQRIVVLVHCCLNPKAIVLRIFQLLCGILLFDHDNHIVCLVCRPSDVLKNRLRFCQIHNSNPQNQTNQQTEHNACEIALFSCKLEPECLSKQYEDYSKKRKQYNPCNQQKLPWYHSALPQNCNKPCRNNRLQQKNHPAKNAVSFSPGEVLRHISISSVRQKTSDSFQPVKALLNRHPMRSHYCLSHNNVSRTFLGHADYTDRLHEYSDTKYSYHPYHLPRPLQCSMDQTCLLH